MKNTIYIISGLLFMVAIVAVVLAMKKEELSKVKDSNASTGIEALLLNYDKITDYETQTQVWLHVLKTCPYWKAMVTEQAKSYGDNIEDRFVIEARFAIQKNRNPNDYMKKCNDKWSDNANKTLCIKLQSELQNKNWMFNWGAKKRLEERIKRVCN